MKSYIVFDHKGNWKLMDSEEAAVYQSNDYESYQLLNYLWKICRLAIKTGLFLALIINTKNFSTPNLQLAFMTLLFIELSRQIGW